MARPSPSAGAGREKRLKTRSRASAGMPAPIAHREAAAAGLIEIATSTAAGRLARIHRR